MGVVVSEELKNGAEGITARVEHDVVVIPVKHIRTGHIPQARMKHIVLEHVFLRNTLHVIEILSVAHNEELELLNLRCMAGERTALLHQIGHDSFQHNRDGDEYRVDAAVMRKMFLEKNDHRLVEGVDIL